MANKRAGLQTQAKVNETFLPKYLVTVTIVYILNIFYTVD